MPHAGAQGVQVQAAQGTVTQGALLLEAGLVGWGEGRGGGQVLVVSISLWRADSGCL